MENRPTKSLSWWKNAWQNACHQRENRMVRVPVSVYDCRSTSFSPIAAPQQRNPCLPVKNRLPKSPPVDWINKIVRPLKYFRRCFLLICMQWQMALPSRAICRRDPSASVPVISNLGMSSAVEKYVEALRTSGIDGWESAGTKFKVWQETRRSCTHVLSVMKLNTRLYTA